MNWLRTRDKAVVAIVMTLILGTFGLAAMNAKKLPLLNPATYTYHAVFESAGGLKPKTDVRVAGISVGIVKDVKVRDGAVVVDFTVERSVKLGSTTQAGIEIATVLGSLYLKLTSSGPGRLSPGSTIPIERTDVPFSLVTAFGALADITTQVDLPTMKRSLDELALTVNAISPNDLSGALRGLTRMSNALASRQNEISQLLKDTQRIVDVLNSRSAQLIEIMTNGTQFLELLRQRHEVIANLLRDTRDLGKQVNDLIVRNGAKLGDLFRDIQTVTQLLQDNKDQLERSMALLGQFSINIANVTGSGPWLDLMLPLLAHPDNVVKACGANPTPRCGSGA